MVNKCPIWNGFAMFGDEYSTTTFFPSPTLEEPYFSFSLKTFSNTSFMSIVLSTKKFK